MSKIKLIGLVGLFYLLTPVVLYGQLEEEVIYFDRLSTDFGLLANTYNYHVRQDSKGIVWISSFRGLTRFNSQDQVLYRPIEKDTATLADPNVQSPVFEDSLGRLWFNTSTSLHYYDPLQENFRQIPVSSEDDKAFSDFQVIHLQLEENRLWFLAEKSVIGDYHPLYTMDLNRPGALYLLDSIPSYSPDDLKVIQSKDTGENYFLYPSSNGLEVRKYNERQRLGKRFLQLGTDDNQVFSTFVDEEDRLWIGTTEGLYLSSLEGENFGTPVCLAEGCIQGIKGIVRFDTEHLLIATEKLGLFFFNVELFQYTHRVSFTQGGYILPFRPNIGSMYLDDNGNLWIASKSQGIFYTNLRKKRFSSYLQRRLSNHYSNNVKSIVEGPDCNYWSLTDDRIVITDGSGQILEKTKRLKPEGLLSDKVGYYIYCDTGGNMWVCTDHGIFLSRAGEDRFTEIPKKDSSRTHVITYLYELENGRLLAASYGEGVFDVVEENGSYFLMHRDDSVDSVGAYNTMYEDSDHCVYAAKIGSGIKIIFPDKEEQRKSLFLNFEPMVHAIAGDSVSNVIWIGSSEGLYKVDKSLDSIYLQKDSIVSLKYPVINAIAFDEQNQMWISTTRGLLLYTPSDDTNIQNQELPSNQLRVFGLADGLQEYEFNFSSFAKTRQGELCFGGTNGYTLFEPHRVTPYPIPAKPVISKILINGKPVQRQLNSGSKGSELEESLQLDHRTRTISLYFSSMDYGHYSSSPFQYYLKTSDNKIIDQGTNTFTNYFNLSPGTYSFELYSANSENVWSTLVKQLHIKIRPHWSKTNEFYFFIGLSVLSIIVLIYRNRLEQARKKQHLAELENSILRIKMNPHFIFNSLNSILGYLKERHIEIASNYLRHLAKLVRQVLETADNPYSSLQEEKEFLYQYVNAQSLRFENIFDFKFIMSTDIDPDEIVIPTMLLQPFVENSIIHGFKGREVAGEITIEFWINNDTLHCTVTDNGIGRVASKSETTKHRSLGLEITLKRLKAMEEQTGQSTSFHIKDLVSSEGEALGTKVHLMMPIL